MYHEHSEHQVVVLVVTEVLDLKPRKAKLDHEEKEAIEVEQTKVVKKANVKGEGHEGDEQQASTERSETAKKLRRAMKKENKKGNEEGPEEEIQVMRERGPVVLDI